MVNSPNVGSSSMGNETRRDDEVEITLGEIITWALNTFKALIWKCSNIQLFT